LDAVRAFEAAYGGEVPEAVAKIHDDVEVLLYAAEHWIHLRMTDESSTPSVSIRL
jgi:hypothetical protein